MSFLHQKKILFISPRFFGYEEEIANKLKEMNADVMFFDDRPSNSVFVKALIRIHRNFLHSRIKSYYNRILDKIRKEKIDYFFLIKGESIPPDFIRSVKELNPDCIFIMYQYDSVRNNRNAVNCFPLFDRIFTFDKEDALQYPNLHFRPLFYIDDYRNMPQREPEFDITFIGTAHSDRYFLIKEMVKPLQTMQMHPYLFFYCPGKLVYYSRKLLQKNFRAASKKDISFTPLRKKEVVNIISRSKAVIDIQHPNQTGLTMRTIEMIGGKKKLITTNTGITSYDFYCPENILVVDRKNPSIDVAFLNIPFKEIDSSVYEKYAISYWLKEIFKGNEQ